MAVNRESGKEMKEGGRLTGTQRHNSSKNDGLYKLIIIIIVIGGDRHPPRRGGGGGRVSPP
jgi:hypothetical protein